MFLGIVEGVTEFLPIVDWPSAIARQPHRFSRVDGRYLRRFHSVWCRLAVVASTHLTCSGRPRTPTNRIPPFLAGDLHPSCQRQCWACSCATSSRPAFTSPNVIACRSSSAACDDRRRACSTSEDHRTRDENHLASGRPRRALVPGVSRSGHDHRRLLAGLDRSAATTFSIYLAIPTLGAATLYDLARSIRGLTTSDLAFLVVGTVTTGIVAWLSIGWLLRYVAHNTFVPFGIYRIAAGLIVLALVNLHVI